MNIKDIAEDIYYIDEIDDRVFAHTKDNTCMISATLLSLKDTLEGNFYYVNPSTIVNGDKVVECNYIDCILSLDNGEKIYKIIKKYNIC